MKQCVTRFEARPRRAGVVLAAAQASRIRFLSRQKRTRRDDTATNQKSSASLYTPRLLHCTLHGGEISQVLYTRVFPLTVDRTEHKTE